MDDDDDDDDVTGSVYAIWWIQNFVLHQSLIYAKYHVLASE